MDEEVEESFEKLRRPPSSAPRWPSPSSHTPSCFPDRAVRPDCLPDCWGLAHPATTMKKEQTVILLLFWNIIL